MFLLEASDDVHSRSNSNYWKVMISDGTFNDMCLPTKSPGRKITCQKYMNITVISSVINYIIIFDILGILWTFQLPTNPPNKNKTKQNKGLPVPLAASCIHCALLQLVSAAWLCLHRAQTAVKHRVRAPTNSVALASVAHENMLMRLVSIYKYTC